MPHFREVSSSGTTEFLFLSLTRLFGLIRSVTFDSHEDLIDKIHAYHSTVKDYKVIGLTFLCPSVWFPQESLSFFLETPLLVGGMLNPSPWHWDTCKNQSFGRVRAITQLLVFLCAAGSTLAVWSQLCFIELVHKRRLDPNQSKPTAACIQMSPVKPLALQVVFTSCAWALPLSWLFCYLCFLF